MNMGIEWIFFPVALFTLLAGSVVVFSRHAVTSVLALVMTFVGASVLWMLLSAEFLSLVLILVYVGAVMTLFLFVVMMMNLKTQTEQEGWVSYWPFAVVMVAVLLGLLMYVVGPRSVLLFRSLSEPVFSSDYSNVRALGEVLYTEHVWSFEVASLILLVGIVAAIALVFSGPRERRSQNIDEQVRTQKSDRLRIVSMESESKKESE